MKKYLFILAICLSMASAHAQQMQTTTIITTQGGNNLRGGRVAPTPEQQMGQQMQRSEARPQGDTFKNDQVIEPFETTDINGVKILPEDWAGKTVVLNFWFINCAPCREEMPELNDLVSKYADNPNVIFIGIAPDKQDDIQEFIKSNPFAYHLVAGGRSYINQFGVRAFPNNVVIDKDGKIVYHHSGYWSRGVEQLASAIAMCDRRNKKSK
jgi:peroxiredoxin